MASKKKAAVKRPPSPAKTDGLLAQILASPDDRTARLIYADRALEADDPRGLFIANQCGLNELDSIDPRYAPMLASARRLQAAHAKTWLGDYLQHAKVDPEFHTRTKVDRSLNAIFENGFLHRVTMGLSDIEKEWPRLREREPIAGVQLIVGEHIDKPYRKLEAPREFRLLKISPESWFTSHSVADVLAWGMPQLRDLDLSGCDMGERGCQLLANQKTDLKEHFPEYVAPPPFAKGQLTHLALKNCGIGDAGAQILFAAENLIGLEALDIGQCKIDKADTLKALATSPSMKKLDRLSLAGNNSLSAHLDVLAGWDVLTQLTHFAPPQTTSGATLKTLWPKASTKLRELDLSSAKELLKAPSDVFERAEAFSLLDLGTTSLGGAGFAALIAAPSVERVVHLFVNGCSLEDDAIHALTKSKLRSLVTLDLSSNKLTDKALTELASWPGLAHVTHLRLSNNRKLSAAGYQALIEAKAFHPAVLDIGKADASLQKRLTERFGDVVVAK